MTNLKAVKEGFNKFCGPAVLSIVTGRNTDECARAISQVNGQYEIKGVYLKDLKLALDKLGFKSDEVPFVGRSLYSAIMSIVQHNGVYIVQLEKHYVCIEIIDKVVWFNDNHTKEPMPAASSARLMNGVVSISKVETKPKPPMLPVKWEYAELMRVECGYCWAGHTYDPMNLLREAAPKLIQHRHNCEYWLAAELNK
jgi:hypothetical protein